MDIRWSLVIVSALTVASCKSGRPLVDASIPHSDLALIYDLGSESDASPGPDLAVCDDNIGTGADCTPFAGHTECEPSCTNLNNYMKHQVAKAAANCIVQGNFMCVVGAGDCALNAAKAACPDSSAQVACGTIFANCASDNATPILTQQECQNRLSGFTSDGRDFIVNCVGNCLNDIETCIQSI